MLYGSEMTLKRTLLLAVSTLLLTANSAHAEPRVVASIKPVHSLVSAVMEGVAAPDLIVTGAGSPHDYALKPSQASLLEKADPVRFTHQLLQEYFAAQRLVQAIENGLYTPSYHVLQLCQTLVEH